MRQYADIPALTAYPGGATVPVEDADAHLRTASRVVDRLLTGIVYDTDTDGLPTDTDVAEAMSDATCAIVVEAIATGALAAGGTQQWDSVKIGNVSLGAPRKGGDTLVVYGLPIPTAALVALSAVGPMGVWVR